MIGALTQVLASYFSALLSWLVEFSWLCSTLEITALLAASSDIVLIIVKRYNSLSEMIS